MSKSSIVDKTQVKSLQIKMQRILDSLGIPLAVEWIPTPSQNRHGEIDEASKTLFIYDSNEDEAWKTFTHEILELKLQQVTRVYRIIINSLIEALEKTAYTQKEQYLNFCLELIEKIKR